MASSFVPARRRPPTAQARGSVVERLEGRSLLNGVAPVLAPAVGEAADAVGPVIIGQQIIGAVEAATRVVLTFSEPLNPATAQNPRAYVLVKHVPVEGEDEDDGFFGVPFTENEGEPDSSVLVRVRFTAAAYDEATRTVTLTPVRTFNARKRFRVLRVAARGDQAIQDVAGNPLDGDGDGRAGDNGRIKFKARRSGTLQVRDADGDRLTLRLTGPGRLVSIERRRFSGPPGPMIFIDQAQPARSVLTGQVRPSGRGDGIVDLAQLTGISTAQVQILNDPTIRIGSTQT